MNSFQEWFDSPMYESMYAHRDDQEAEKLSSLIHSRFPVDQYPRLLDLACGRGRHCLNLARVGYALTGVDLAPRAIAIAREKLASQHLKADFICGDMRVPLPDTFDGIVNLFTSFGYFDDDEENRSVLRAMHEMLRPGGFLVLDYLNERWVRDTLVPEESGSFDTCEYTIRRWISGSMVMKKISTQRPDVQVREFNEQVKLYGNDWFTHELTSLGFRITERLGDYDGSPFDPARSPRLIIIASL
jgi:SAM-dependent methyltransferase